MRQPFVRRAEAVTAFAVIDLVARVTEIADDQFLIGKSAVNQRFQPAEMLHAVRERVADVANVVAFFELDERIGGVGTEGKRQSDERGEKTVTNHAVDSVCNEVAGTSRAKVFAL